MSMISPKMTYVGPPISDQETFQRLPSNLREVLHPHNGYVLFDGGLHIRGATIEPEWHSISEMWLGTHSLCRLFSGLTASDIPFGEDCLGDQFLLRSDEVVKLHAETGQIVELHIGASVFLQMAHADPIEFLGLQPLLEFQKRGGILKPGELIDVYPPFCTKESGQGVSMKSMPTLERILFLADFARQIANMKDGEKIRIQTRS